MIDNHKIYIITHGCYSAYHICAVTTDRNTAEYLQKVYSGGYDGEANIEEWDMIAAPEDVHEMFRVEFDFGNINVEVDKFNTHEDIYGDCNDMTVYVYATGKDTALKIAQDRRAEYLAKLEGVTD